MYSGFITPKRTVKRLGIHQRLDKAAYQMVSSFFEPGTFPSIREILHFEGFNGPDGIKVKSLGHDDPSHMYDPITDKGHVPELIHRHYRALVSSLARQDMVRASFEASWLAHFVADGLTPAHHFPYDELKEELFGKDSAYGFLKRNWHWFGWKGVISTHMNFEMGIAVALLVFPIKAKIDIIKLAHAKQIGALGLFKQEAKVICDLGLYDRFYKFGWTARLVQEIKNKLAPNTAQLIGMIWLLAYLEASIVDAKGTFSLQRQGI